MCFVVPYSDQNAFQFFYNLSVTRLTNIIGVALRNRWHPVEIWPSQGLVYILYLQPINYRFKVVHQRVGVHFVGADGLLQHLCPGLGGASLKDFPGRGISRCLTPIHSHTVHAWRTVNDGSGHSLHNCSCFLGFVDVTSVQGPRVVRFTAQLFMKLELQNEADKISAVEANCCCYTSSPIHQAEQLLDSSCQNKLLLRPS